MVAVDAGRFRRSTLFREFFLVSPGPMQTTRTLTFYLEKVVVVVANHHIEGYNLQSEEIIPCGSQAPATSRNSTTW